MWEFLTLLFLLIIVSNSGATSSKHHKTNRQESIRTTTSDNMRSLESNRTYEEYTRWSTWSRCMNCYQRRMKTCISISCEGSRMYEEKPCKKKRCKRKLRQRDEFHVVRLTENSSFLTKQGPSEIWSKWSSWSPCTHACRTYRYRKCKKPGRCSKQILKEEAYCYHERSNCEIYVLNLMETNRNYDAKRYQYNNNNSDTAVRQPRKKVDTVKRCGIPHKKSKMLRIIGGSESRKYKWPWHVAILNQHMEVICGGTLIAPRWILTANHCIRKYLRVRLNAHDLRARDGSDIEMSVHKMFPHPKFDYKTVDNDIALLMLPRSVRTPVACLPNKRPKSRQLCSVMGWGKVDPGDFFGIPVLHEAKLPIVTADTCRKSNKQLYISENMLCAGWASGIADTCAGDSGGGLMCPTKRYKKTIYSVQGITSFGDGCGMKNKYGIYTTVFNYVGWINYIIDHYS